MIKINWLWHFHWTISSPLSRIKRIVSRYLYQLQLLKARLTFRYDVLNTYTLPWEWHSVISSLKPSNKTLLNSLLTEYQTGDWLESYENLIVVQWKGTVS